MSTTDTDIPDLDLPVPDAPATLPTDWVKLRDVLLSGQARGHVMPDERTLGAEAALVLTWDGRALVLEGSYRRLLKTLDYARHQLLTAAPELELVIEVPPEIEDEEDYKGIPALRCPHCGYLTFDGGEVGLRLVQSATADIELGFDAAHERRARVVGEDGQAAPMTADHFECDSCDRPVNLPPGVGIHLGPRQP